MTQTSLLLGAGFSVNKGYPTANALAKKLTGLKAEDFCVSTEGFVCFLTGGKKDPFTHLSYFKNKLFTIEFIQFYLALTGSFDYEKFYDFYHGILNGTIKSSEFEDFANEFRKLHHFDEDDKNLLSNHNRIFNQLVSSFIVDEDGKKFYTPAFCLKPIYPGYTGVLQCLENWGKQGIVHIHSLNHDLFFESLSATEWLNGELSDGFKELGSPYYGRNQEGHNIRLSCFTENYNKTFRLYKLHGSFDQFAFHTQSGLDGYIKTKKGISKIELYKEVVDPKNGELSYFNDWINYHSDFLTGTTSKILRYREPLFYDKVFRHFEQNLKNSDLLIVIGYGCGDSEINNIIETFYPQGKPIFIVEPYPNSNTDAFCQKFNAKLIQKTPDNMAIQDFQ